MPKKKMSKEEMMKAARIAARHAKFAKKADKKKKKESTLSMVRRKLAKMYGRKKAKVFETESTKSVKRGLENAGTKFKTDAEREAEKRKKKKEKK